MKGLLYKEFLMAVKHCRAFLLLAVVFAIVLLFEPGNTFYMAYPCIFVGIIPVTLLSYDERDKWNQFSAVLPVSRAKLVSVKYLIGLLLQLVIVLTAGIASFIGLSRVGQLVWEEYLTMLAVLVPLSLLPPAILLPFVFKLGVEKGRIAYYLVLGSCAAAASILAMGDADLSGAMMLPGWGMGIVLAVSVAVYAASWLLSIRFYEKKEF